LHTVCKRPLTRWSNARGFERVTTITARARAASPDTAIPVRHSGPCVPLRWPPGPAGGGRGRAECVSQAWYVSLDISILTLIPLAAIAEQAFVFPIALQPQPPRRSSLHAPTATSALTTGFGIALYATRFVSGVKLSDIRVCCSGVTGASL